MDQIEAVEFSGEEMRTLCASSLFCGYTRMEIASLLTRFDVRRKAYSDGAVVADEQEAPTRMGVLLSGSLHVYDSALKGRRHLVRIVRPGEVLGATLSGVSARQAYPALVRAYGPCVLATFSLSLVDKFMKHGGGAFYDNLSIVVHDELQTAWRKIAILSCPNIADRVMLYLQDRSRREGTKTVVIGSTEADFADYLGVSRSALARELRKLAKEGKFTYKRDVFTLP